MIDFELGEIIITRGIADKMKEDKSFANFVQLSLGEYINCDWGTLDDADKDMNDAAVKSGDERILAAYEFRGNTKIWIITEWDRSATTILFPSEY